MGVYIKGLKMPESCKECPFKTCFIRVNIKSYTCLINGGECGKTDCPLIEIDLVRCEECKYYEESEYIEGDMACKYHIGHTYYTEADRFCYYGERNSKNNSNQI